MLVCPVCALPPATGWQPCCFGTLKLAEEQTGHPYIDKGVLKGVDFFLLRIAPRDHQPPTAANRHQPPIPKPQPPSTTTNAQLPTAHRQHMVCPRAFLGKLCKGTFFFPVKDRPVYKPTMMNLFC